MEEDELDKLVWRRAKVDHLEEFGGEYEEWERRGRSGNEKQGVEKKDMKRQ